MDKVVLRKTILSVVTALLFVPIPVFAVWPDLTPAWFATPVFGAAISVWLTAFAMLAMVVITRVEVGAPAKDGKIYHSSH